MLLSDFIQVRREKRIETAKVEGIAEGIVEGIAEGEARAYRKFAEWDRRRKEAEARGEEFTEPPPTQPQEQSQEKPKE